MTPSGVNLATMKGEKLEQDIFLVISQMIAEDRFFVRQEHCRRFHKKGYYSKDRKKEIVFDISIEVTLPGMSSYSLLILIECKNYSHRVPVDDIEEFYTKTQQISPSNIKAIVASNNAFQEGAFNFAGSKGIGLLRYFAADSLEWVLARSPSSMSVRGSAATESGSAYEGLRDQRFSSRYFDFFCFSGNACTNTINHFFSRLVRDDADDVLSDALSEVEQNARINTRIVPYLEGEQIEEHAKRVLAEIGYSNGSTCLEDVCDRLSGRRDLRVELRSLAPGILGSISFQPLQIELDIVQAGSAARYRFTLAHELGHLFLGHDEYMFRDVCRESDVEFEKNSNIEVRDIARMEWQANYFAACLLVPTPQLVRSAQKYVSKQGLFDRGHGLIYLDGQPCNSVAFYSITSPLMAEFGVSRSVLKIRLKELGLLNEGADLPGRVTPSIQWPGKAS